MSYHIHHCDALIVAVHPHGEESATVQLFTETHGSLLVHAQGLRSLRSKLRYYTVAPRFASVSLVRGRQRWRLVGVIPLASLALARELEPLLARVGRLVVQLCYADDPHPELFRSLTRWVASIQKQSLSVNEREQLELLLVLLVLRHSGYDPEIPFRFTEEEGYSSELAQLCQQHRSRTLAAVNHALAASAR